MTVKGKFKDYSKLSELAVERAMNVAIANIQEEAVTAAPKDTGAYARNIVADFNNKEVRAEIIYSRVVEYGFKGRKPTANMRLAARKVQKNLPQIINRELRKVL